MAYTNGRIPASALVTISSNGARLLSGPAAAWRRIVSKVQSRYGWTPVPSGPNDGYRPLEVQVSTFLARYVPAKTGGGYYGDVRWWNGVRYVRKRGAAAAAVPGTSNHGKGRAVDVSGLGGFSGVRYRQFMAVAAEEGWSNAEGKSVGESWHMVDLRSPETVSSGHATVPNTPTPINPTLPTAPKDWFDMASAQELTNIVNAAVAPLMGELGRIGTRLKEIDSADEVTRVAYRDYLGREATGNEVDNWVLTVVNQGITTAHLRDLIAVSGEANAARKRTAAEAYITGLGRKASDAEAQNWANMVATLADIRKGILGSAEAKAFAALPAAEQTKRIAAARAA